MLREWSDRPEKPEPPTLRRIIVWLCLIGAIALFAASVPGIGG